MDFAPLGFPFVYLEYTLRIGVCQIVFGTFLLSDLRFKDSDKLLSHGNNGNAGQFQRDY